MQLPSDDDPLRTVNLDDPEATGQFDGVLSPTTAVGAAPDLPGYEIQSLLGKGGMGVVYRAFDQKRRQTVALKTLHQIDPGALYGLKQEFRSLTEVAHPNLVNYFELVAAEPHWFLTMELVEGKNLLEHVRGLPGPPRNDAGWDTLRAALRQLATGVMGLHHLGKLHRDLKHSNVLVARDGRVVILDFGLATELNRGGGQEEADHKIVGTAAYMSPEQAAAEPVSPASDWYSFGVMLFELLTGRLPFEGSWVNVLASKQRQEAPDPSLHCADAPADLVALCRELLRRDPSERPSGAAVLARLGGSVSIQTAPSGEDRPTFVGREKELAAIRAAYAASRDRGVAALVHGRSGVGKSMLVQQALAKLTETDNVVVLSGKCYERESVPYKALDSLVDALSRYLSRISTAEAAALLPPEIHGLARVFPVLGRVEAVSRAPGESTPLVDPHEARRRAFAALRELFSRLANTRPLVLYIDDLQWGDAESAAVLVDLVRPPEPPRMLLVGGYRSEELETSSSLRMLLKAWHELLPPGDLQSVEVAPLPPEDAMRLAGALLRPGVAADAARLADLAQESRGNPFFVQVLVQRLNSGHAASDEPATSRVSLDDVLWDRIQTLSPAARKVLEAVAVSGQPLSQDSACEAADLADQQRVILAGLRFERLIRSAGPAENEEIETFHDRVRETILDRLSLDVKQGHHLWLAEAIERRWSSETGLPKNELAGSLHTASARTERDPRRLFDLSFHFDAAGDGRRALPYALAAASHGRARHALQIAEQQFRIALRGAAAAESAIQMRAAEGLGEVLLLGGKYEEARMQFMAAREFAITKLDQARLGGKLGEAAFKRGDLPAASAPIEDALRLLGKRVPRQAWIFGPLIIWEGFVQTLHTLLPGWFLARRPLAGSEAEFTAFRLYSRLSYTYWFCRGGIPCMWAHLRDLNLAERYPATPELAQAYSEHAAAMSMTGQFSRGLAYAEKSLAMRRTQGDLWGQGQTLHFRAIVLYAAARFHECVETSREASRLLEQTGDPWERNSARYQLALSLYRLGDLKEAHAEAWRFHQSALELGDLQGAAMSLDIWSLAAQGRVPADIIQRELAQDSADVQRTAQVMLAEAVRLLAEDRPSDAAQLLEVAVAKVRQAGIRNAYVSPVYAWRVTALRREAERSADRRLMRRAERASRQALRIARTFRGDLPHALREAARLAARRGRIARARTLLDKSLETARRMGSQHEAAQTRTIRSELAKRFGWPAVAAHDEHPDGTEH